jgi:SAM-dependent methyltransferase
LAVNFSIACYTQVSGLVANSIDYHDRFDLVMAFICIHDMAQPRAALVSTRRALKSDGVFLWSEADASDQLEENLTPVLSQNLNSDVLMMESTEDWYRCDGAELLRSPKIRRILFQ